MLLMVGEMEIQLEEIRQNASANFATQLRNVTQDDYLVRALSMPAKYGVISKAYIEPTKAQSYQLANLSQY
jgi:hypothetical protein